MLQSEQFITDSFDESQGRASPLHLHWIGVPPTAGSLALIVDDRDAYDPVAPQRSWVRWVASTSRQRGRTAARSGTPLPSGARDGLNDWHRASDGGPWPPVGRHRYFFKLYTLDIRLAGLRQPTRAQVEHAMRGHIGAQAELVWTYQKTQR